MKLVCALFGSIAVGALIGACSSSSAVPADESGTTDAAATATTAPDGAVLPTVDGATPPPVPTADGGTLQPFDYRAYSPVPSDNPAGLTAYVEAPKGNPARTVVVVLHGCTQRASDMAQSGWSDAASAYGFVAVYPEQSIRNDANTCFRWYATDQAAREKGEAASIAAFAKDAKTRFGADHVYIAGLSAGGAMAAAMLATYPDVFEAGSFSAGIPFRCGTNAFEGGSCAGLPRTLSPKEWGDLVRAAGTPSPQVRVQIWQGDLDPIVKPGNADGLVAQWTDVAGVDTTADQETQDGAVQRRVYQDGAGKARVEIDLVRGMGHGFSIATSGAEAPCGKSGLYALDTGACAASGAARFFGLKKL